MVTKVGIDLTSAFKDAPRVELASEKWNKLISKYQKTIAEMNEAMNEKLSQPSEDWEGRLSICRTNIDNFISKNPTFKLDWEWEQCGSQKTYSRL